jgi:hypothetical protein
MGRKAGIKVRLLLTAREGLLYSSGSGAGQQRGSVGRRVFVLNLLQKVSDGIRVSFSCAATLAGGFENKVLPQKVEPFGLSSSSHSKIEQSRHSSSIINVSPQPDKCVDP